MTVKSGERCLVVVADDLGKSSSINRAVREAHENGIVTSASIMAAGSAFSEAVGMARDQPGLSVGLHVTLCDGKSVLPRDEIPDLVDESGNFEKSPSRAWINYSRPDLRRQIEKEVKAQFDLLEKAGMQPTHVDGHHHLHMHPAVFGMICRTAARRGIGWIRIPREPVSMALGQGLRAGRSLVEWFVFSLLDLFHRRDAKSAGLRTADRVFGLAFTGRVDEQCLLSITGRMGDVLEVFTHPDLATTAGRRELQALLSPDVREGIALKGMTLRGYGGLSSGHAP